MENPELLHLLWILLLYALVLWVYWRWRARTLRQLGSPALAERLLLGFSMSRFWLKNAFFAGALALLAVAIANPRRSELRTPPPQESADVLIALDISQSMLAKDALPSRLEQAKTFIQKLAAALEGERIGLLFFAGEAYPQMPLSTDIEALMVFARNASTDFAQDQGTDFSTAIELATRLFEADADAGHALVIISDGEHHESSVLLQAKKAHEDGMIIHTVSVGSAAGAPIPAGGKNYKRDFRGQIINTVANEALLRDIARAGGGTAFSINDANAVRQIVREVDSLQKNVVQAQGHLEYVSYFQWLVLPALLLLMVEQVLWWRKKKSVFMLLVPVWMSPVFGQSGHGASQQGDRLYDKKEYGRAEQAYRSATSHPSAAYNAGNAAFQQGKYEEAAGFYKTAAANASAPGEQSDAQYNLGNTYLRQEKYAAAIAAYQKSLRLQPNRPDAKKNLQIAIKKLRERQEPPPPPPPNSPPPPPPPAPKPQRNYLDRPQQAPRNEPATGTLTPEAARQLLETVVAPEEQKSAREYRELSPSTRPSRVKKDW